MIKPLLVKLAKGKEIILEEINISTVRQQDHDQVVVTMNSGEQLIITNPSWAEWLNDVHQRKD